MGSQNQQFPIHTLCMYPKSLYHLSQSEIVDAHKIEVISVLGNFFGCSCCVWCHLSGWFLSVNDKTVLLYSYLLYEVAHSLWLNGSICECALNAQQLEFYCCERVCICVLRLVGWKEKCHPSPVTTHHIGTRNAKFELF